ncbi:MAG: beta-eliminating lyase-related protein [Oscillospiraceae bacterium]|nr:beta-eliminating lyase-related protein [Oscillospiraceae bacterium]
MISFENDYAEGAHPAVLQHLFATNLVQQPGYGNDAYSEAAKEKIRNACHAPHADIRFVVGGTQTNALVIGTVLNPYEGVVAAETGHINVHEAGAVEYTGHKVLTIPQHEGKICARELEAYLEAFRADGTHEHMVFPGMVYISHPTEYGTLYTRGELTDISRVCRRFEIPLFLDGARLGYGLMSPGTDVDLPFLSEVCDVFYIGGTKVGALCGEAVVFPRGNAPRHFVTMVKQRGAMVAKGRLLGVQFDALFTDGLYFSISAHAIAMAQKLKAGFAAKGYPFLLDSPTNQQFVILNREQMERLGAQVKFSIWEPVDGERTAVRFATSWAPRGEDVDTLLALL